MTSIQTHNSNFHKNHLSGVSIRVSGPKRRVLTLHGEFDLRGERLRRDAVGRLAAVHSLVIVGHDGEDELVLSLAEPGLVREVDLLVVLVPVSKIF